VNHKRVERIWRQEGLKVPKRELASLTIIDECSRECPAIRVARKLSSNDVLTTLARLFIQRGTPAYLRSDNGSEFTAVAVRRWLERLGVRTLFIEPCSSWENR